MSWFKRKPKIQERIFLSCVYNCGKEKCPLWVILDTNYTIENPETKQMETKTKPEGKCAIAWLPSLLIDLRMGIEKKEHKDDPIEKRGVVTD